MPSTPAYELPYPDPADAPDGPLAFELLAEQVEEWLSRAWPVANAAARIAIADPPEGLIVRERDSGAVYIASDTGAWTQLGAGASGGGSTSAAQYSANTNQSVPHNRQVALSFGSADRVTSEVTRFAYRPDTDTSFGHGFELNASGIWTLSATVRYATSTQDGERYAGIHLTSGEPLTGSGWRFEVGLGGTQTLTCSVPRYFDAGDRIYVHTEQRTGGSRSLDRGTNGGWVRINLARVG